MSDQEPTEKQVENARRAIFGTPRPFESVEEFARHWASITESARISTAHAPWFANALARTYKTIHADKARIAELECAIIAFLSFENSAAMLKKIADLREVLKP